MNTNLARYWAVYTWALTGLALTGCPDDMANPTSSATEATTGGSDPSTGGTQPTTGESTGTTGTPTTGTPTSTTDVTTMSTTDMTTDTTVGSTGTTGESTGAVSASTSSGTTGGDVCMTILCGQPAVCCGAAEECVDGACLPECPSGIRCGEDKTVCCGDGEVCLGDVCEAPLGPCEDSYDCDPGNYCEPVFDQCLPQPDPLDCEVVPNFDTFELQLEWAWTANEVTVTPIVADVDGDGVPDVVVNLHKIDANNGYFGEIVLLDGATGAEKWRINHDPGNNKFGSNGVASVAVGDVSGDGLPDIIYAGRPSTATINTAVSAIHAVDGTGKLLWTGHLANNTTVTARIGHGSATVANLDNDPQAEVAFGALIFDHDGLMVWNQANNGGQFGTPLYLNGGNAGQPIYQGGLATFADLDGDTKPELVTGREAWKINWQAGNPPQVTLSMYWQNKSGSGNDGWPSIVDLDADGDPEVVLTAWPDIRVLNGQTGKLWCGIDPTDAACANNDALRTQPIQIKGGNLGGPATIADFDGDGRPEAGIAGGVNYAVYDFNRPGEQIVKPVNDPMPVAGAMYARWVSAATQDNTSACTGSSVFDFQGDGIAEVSYQDECNAYVYDGATGTQKIKLTNSSGTAHEYPLVADVDGDGNSEFLVVANIPPANAVTSCTTKNAMFMARKGVYLYGSAADNWVPTRKVWTQHTYHVTNADSAGNPPMVEIDNWTTPGLNNFRQNVQGEGVFNAPDLTVSLAADLNKCSAELVLVATIYNEGALGVAAGVEVRFYEGVDNTGMNLGTKPTTEAILPGGSTQVTWTVPGPKEDMKKNFFAEIDPGINDGLVKECQEANNGAIVTEAFCPDPG
jgi:hypothetical protein